MVIEIKVPSPGESISEVQLANWLVSDGDYVSKDQDLAEIDSDKATLSVSAAQAGKISLLVQAGATIEVGSVIARIDTDAAPAEKPAATPVKEEPRPEAVPQKTATEPQPAAAAQPAEVKAPAETLQQVHLSPLARRILEANAMTEKEFIDMIMRFRFGKKDVQFVLSGQHGTAGAATEPAEDGWAGGRGTERKKMTTLRLKLSERLVAVKNETAMLTTFNEVNMTPIMNLRQQYKDIFKEKFGVSLGFMSFFTKAITVALREFPQVNAQIDGDEIVYHQYADIGIAVSTPKGLMVPVLRNAEQMSLADIERKIKELAIKARDGKITLDEMKGGTFTITNGGVFGSMLSTPIINPPQSAILGMHNIVERPIAVDGRVEIHPIMYVALSYDHRIIDGRESVSFLVRVKEMLENPARMMFGGKDPGAALLGLM